MLAQLILTVGYHLKVHNPACLNQKNDNSGLFSEWKLNQTVYHKQHECAIYFSQSLAGREA